MDNICMNCVHWKREKILFLGGIEKDSPYGICNSDKYVYSGDAEEEITPIDGVSYWDYDAYKAGFKTGEKFGCIHFKGTC